MIMSGGLNMLERKDEPGRREMLIGRMREAVERGAKLTQQLLAFSRKHDLAPQTLDFGARVEAMRELLDRSLGGQVRVALDVAPNLTPIYVDPTGLQHALLNLSVNARDAMPEGGVITIKAINGAPNEPREPCVSISVIDTGIGMGPDIMARIFEPFFTTKDIGKGSGLGLAQVHGFAQQSGGRVDVRSAPGKGTTFTLVLPRGEGREAKKELAAPAEARSAIAAGQALLVEDDDDVAALTSEMLSDLGWRVTRAASGEAALAVLATRSDIDFVFSDVMMPGGMNGLEMSRRARERNPDLPILLTSGYAAPVAQEASRAGLPLLPKPFTIEALASAVAMATTSLQSSR
jgi:CheY-like chemotaxis protein